MLCRMKSCGLFLWAATTVYGLSTSLNCTMFTDRTTLLKPYRHCDVTVEHGYIHALCYVHVRLEIQSRNANGTLSTFRMEEELVSDGPVDKNTPAGGTVCLSLRSVKLEKWYEHPLEKSHPYDHTLKANRLPIEFHLIFYLAVLSRQMTLKTTFREPHQAAAAICNKNRTKRNCKFGVYWFERNPHNSSNPVLQSFRYFIPNFLLLREMDFGSLSVDVLNVTLKEDHKEIPGILNSYVSSMPIRYILFYNCNIRVIKHTDISHILTLEKLEFFQTPIQKIDALALRPNPRLKHASFIGTKLPGIPETIFHMKRLESLDISDTDVPRDIKFQLCPLNCQHQSTCKRLVISKTRLVTLSDRAFCGFPHLKELELENCNIKQLSESPFECLENLSNLSLSHNKIRSLGAECLKGLKNLHFLNLNKNRIVHFQGPRTFSTMTSMRTLILSQNDIKKLQLEGVEYMPIEELNLERNQISKWKTPLFATMSKLKSLHLEHNVLSSLGDDMMRDMSHISYVNLSYNSWDCSSCQHKNLLSVLKKHPVYCPNCFVCKNDDHEGRLIFEVPWNKTGCTPPDPYIVYGVPATLSILGSTLVAYVVHRNRWYCMYGLLHLKVAVKSFRRQNQAGRFLWDGFLSYHTSDAEWVRDVLVPKLESAPMNFRLCVAERDFIPGLPIAENICRAIAQSRVSLFVLSREFCRSQWCMFELNLAQHRLFENHRHDGMVFIRKVDLEESEMSSMLTYLMKTRTYVKLPPDDSSETQNNLFWLQVQAALQQ